MSNVSTNSNISSSEELDLLTPQSVVLATLLGIITVMTIVGNLLVMTAILKTRTLRSTQYIFIFCLASTDFTLGLTVLPFATYSELTKQWPFGAVLCNVWVSLDVMLCSASVLHLLLITIDRKLAIKYAIEYSYVVTKPRIALCLVLVWLISVGNSFVTIFSGLNTSDWRVQNVEDDGRSCTYDTSNEWYCLVVGLITFIIPVVLMFAMYIDILHMARVQSRKIRAQQRSMAGHRASHAAAPADHSDGADSGAGMSCRNFVRRFCGGFDSIYRENKATVTVFVIFGLFFVCWFPYMLLFTFWPLTSGGGYQGFPDWLFKIFLWTGYLNSTLNPFLYTLLNTTFRQAMRHLLCPRRSRRSTGLELDVAANGHSKAAAAAPANPSPMPTVHKQSASIALDTHC